MKIEDSHSLLGVLSWGVLGPPWGRFADAIFCWVGGTPAALLGVTGAISFSFSVASEAVAEAVAATGGTEILWVSLIA